MKLEKEEKELLIGICTFVISAFFLWQSWGISLSRYKFIDSARIFPVIISSIMCLLSLGYSIRFYRRCGWIPMAKIAGSAKAFIKDPVVRGTVKAIVMVGVFYGLAAAKGRFYLGSAIFIIFVSSTYVKGNPLWRIIGTLIFIIGSYLLFYRSFHVQLY